MYSDNYTAFLDDLHKKNITHMEYISLTGHGKQYENWCREHHIKPCEANAELYFDMHGFEETETVKEFMEPVY